MKNTKRSLTVFLTALSIAVSGMTMSCGKDADEVIEILRFYGIFISGCEDLSSSSGLINSWMFSGSNLTVTQETYSSGTCATKTGTTTTQLTVTKSEEDAKAPAGAKKIDLTVGPTTVCPVGGTCTTNTSNVGKVMLGVYKVEDIANDSQRLSIGTTTAATTRTEDERPAAFTTTNLIRKKPTTEE